MANVFLISDTHFSHQGVCEFLNPDKCTPLRPWNTAAEMDEAMIANWNKVVRPQDKIYVLGDVAIKKKGLEVLLRCNGTKRLVRGNHDIFETKTYLKYFKEIYGVRVLADMILSHIPLAPPAITQRYKTNVHGHTHAIEYLSGLYFNVSVENINFTPISLEELRVRIKQKKERYGDTKEIVVGSIFDK